MHPGIRSARARRFDRDTGDLLQGLLKRLLHRRDAQVRLCLPAAVRLAKILDPCRDTCPGAERCVGEVQCLNWPPSVATARVPQLAARDRLP